MTDHLTVAFPRPYIIPFFSLGYIKDILRSTIAHSFAGISFFEHELLRLVTPSMFLNVQTELECVSGHS